MLIFSPPPLRKGLGSAAMRPYSLGLPLLALALISACATSSPSPERQAAPPKSSEAAAKPAQATPAATAPAAAQPPVTAAVLPPEISDIWAWIGTGLPASESITAAPGRPQWPRLI